MIQNTDHLKLEGGSASAAVQNGKKKKPKKNRKAEMENLKREVEMV